MLFEFRRDSNLGSPGGLRDSCGSPGLRVSGVPETYKRETASQGRMDVEDVDGG